MGYAAILLSLALSTGTGETREQFCVSFEPVIVRGVIDGQAGASIAEGMDWAEAAVPTAHPVDIRRTVGAYVTAYGQGMVYANPGEVFAEFMFGCLNA